MLNMHCVHIVPCGVEVLPQVKLQAAFMSQSTITNKNYYYIIQIALHLRTTWCLWSLYPLYLYVWFGKSHHMTCKRRTMETGLKPCDLLIESIFVQKGKKSQRKLGHFLWLTGSARMKPFLSTVTVKAAPFPLCHLLSFVWLYVNLVSKKLYGYFKCIDVSLKSVQLYCYFRKFFFFFKSSICH